MILIQKYQSIAEIEEEYIETLESLLERYCPDLTWAHLLAAHQGLPLEGHVLLLFGPQHNRPIGLAQISVRPVSAELLKLRPRMWQRLWTKETPVMLDLELAGLGPGPLIDHRYQQEATRSLQKELKAYSKQFRPLFMRVPRLGINPTTGQQPVLSTVENISFTYHRVHARYHDYLGSLDAQTQEELQLFWQRRWEEARLHWMFVPDINQAQNYWPAFREFYPGPHHPSGQYWVLATERRDRILALAQEITRNGNHIFLHWSGPSEDCPLSTEELWHLCLRQLLQKDSIQKITSFWSASFEGIENPSALELTQTQVEYFPLSSQLSKSQLGHWVETEYVSELPRHS